MNKHRKIARDYLKSFKTVVDLENYLNSLVLSDEYKEITKDIIIKGYTHVQIATKYNISLEKSKKIYQHVLDKVI